jgi:hypothetical protein
VMAMVGERLGPEELQGAAALVAFECVGQACGDGSGQDPAGGGEEPGEGEGGWTLWYPGLLLAEVHDGD